MRVFSWNARENDSRLSPHGGGSQANFYSIPGRKVATFTKDLTAFQTAPLTALLALT